jgi:hypothetical protein
MMIRMGAALVCARAAQKEKRAIDKKYNNFCITNSLIHPGNDQLPECKTID